MKLCRSLFCFLLVATLCLRTDAWVRRQRVKNRKPKYGDVKLVDGATENEGTVIIFKGYDWGTICDDGWDMNEAKIVCRQLGMGDPRDVLKNNHFQSHGFSQMFLDDLECTGNEKNLTECPHFYAWGEHDCHSVRELAGVRCHIKPREKVTYPPWNPLGVESKSKRTIIRMQEMNFTISSYPMANESYGVYLVSTVKGKKGGVCPDDFTLLEATVFCRQMGLGYGKKIYQVNFNPPHVPYKHTLRVGLCYGNETSLDQCKAYAYSRGIPCDSRKTISIVCTNALPDLIPDLATVQSSAYLAQLPMWLLSCSMEERCLSESALSMVDRVSERTWQYMKRNLLRFSSIIANDGTADFIPLDPIDTWEWHACHMHYHSMQNFAKYEIVNRQNFLLAAGHKASFCLEDNECKDPNSRNYRCSTTVHNTGTQGISPGCRDIYLHNYDCQWIDTTDLPLGRFQFRLIVNPEFKVSELNFFNNAIVCDLFHIPSTAFLRNCRFAHPHDI